jgi:cystine transport system substrate-binding protein
MKSNPSDPLEVAATSDEATSYAIPMEKGADNTSLRQAINKAIQEMRDDGTLKKLSEKYFGADLTNK